MLQKFCVMPEIVQMASCKEFVEAFQLGAGDLILTSEHIYEAYFRDLLTGGNIIFIRNYGQGEPSDEMAEAIYQDIKDERFQRVVAIGGGTVLDVAKLFALKMVSPVADLFTGKLPVCKGKQLLLVPTTCGTGSEVTDISILELKSLSTKMGLANPALYADTAVLIPELLEQLPFRVFATSSMDALIHAVESFLSPKATAFSDMFSVKAIEIILGGYKRIQQDGEHARQALLSDFLLAATCAGIAFGNAGCAAVHAMSYPLGALYHVPHGEANYAVFTGVFQMYLKLNPEGKIQQLNQQFSRLLSCSLDDVSSQLENLLSCIVQKKSLHEYGMKETEIDAFAQNVLKNQRRLLANNYVPFTADEIRTIYQNLY